MMNIAQTTEPRAALASGTVKKRIRMCGSPAVPSTSARPSDTVSIGDARKVPGRERERRLGGRVGVRVVEQLDRVEADPLEHEQRHHDDAGHQQHGLDDLHPRGGEHAAEDHVAEHEDAGEDHGEREVDADERLDEHARADHLRDQVEGDDGQRAERRRGARRLLVQPERQDVGDRVLAGVAHALGQQEHHGEEGDEEPDRVQEPVEAVEVDQARDAEERGGGQVVAGDREAVLEARDLAAGGVERRGAGHALRRPVGDAERDREDDREDHHRLDVDGGEDGHRVASRVPLVGAPAAVAREARGRRRAASSSRAYAAIARSRERVELVSRTCAGTRGRARRP